jgi:hypothetical protein
METVLILGSQGHLYVEKLLSAYGVRDNFARLNNKLYRFLIRPMEDISDFSFILPTIVMLFYNEREETQRALSNTYSIVSAYFHQARIIIVRTTTLGNSLLNKYETRFRHYTLTGETSEELITCLSDRGFDNCRDPESRR